MKLSDSLKAAIACDWLTGIGGAELVVLEFHKMLPKAPVYTSQYNPKKIDWFKNADVRTTWINKLPKSLKKFLPVLRAISFSRLDLSGYDLVISSSGAEAKAVKTGDSSTHICYCHSPTHYYWIRYEEYLRDPGFGPFNLLAKVGLRLLVEPMRKWDYRAAQKPDYLIANSNYTKANILKYYGRESEVIYPPVDVEAFHTANKPADKRSGYVITSRQTPYKRVDLAVLACTKLGLNLTVVGSGPQNTKLKAMAGPTIKFPGQINDQTKIKTLGSAKGFIFPVLEDFGISAVEALAAGTPVIAYRGGGPLDYINESNGLFFDEQSVDSLCKALKKFESLEFNNAKVAVTANKFSTEMFDSSFKTFVEKL